MVTRIFDSHDTELYSTWHLEEGGIVSLVVPEFGEVRMSLAKAEEISQSIARQASYGRHAAETLTATTKVNDRNMRRGK